MRRRLPVKFLIGILILAVVWFIVMFQYMDDLVSDEAKGALKSKVRLGQKEEFYEEIDDVAKYVVINEILPTVENQRQGKNGNQEMKDFNYDDHIIDIDVEVHGNKKELVIRKDKGSKNHDNMKIVVPKRHEYERYQGLALQAKQRRKRQQVKTERKLHANHMTSPSNHNLKIAKKQTGQKGQLLPDFLDSKSQGQINNLEKLKGKIQILDKNLQERLKSHNMNQHNGLNPHSYVVMQKDGGLEKLGHVKDGPLRNNADIETLITDTNKTLSNSAYVLPKPPSAVMNAPEKTAETGWSAWAERQQKLNLTPQSSASSSQTLPHQGNVIQKDLKVGSKNSRTVHRKTFTSKSGDFHHRIRKDSPTQPFQENRQLELNKGLPEKRPYNDSMQNMLLHSTNQLTKVERKELPGSHQSRKSGNADDFSWKKNLTFDQKLDLTDGYRRHSFNVEASEKFSLDRDIPDTRPQGCPKQFNSFSFPQASIIICFHNEAWSTLLRTIHSILNRTAPYLLREIILVDDFSSKDYLGAKLEEYLTALNTDNKKISLVRTSKREGLIRARLLGVSYAQGEVIVFLDSHTECNVHWLEPLLQALQWDRNKIVCPEIDIIKHDTFEYVHSPEGLHGGFDWNLQFVWKGLPEKEIQRRKSDADTIRTPTMIGGLFAVDRRFFYDIGLYDTGLEIWGGENLELSFRVWMCGGSLEIVPCSRVGHVFRPVIPYSFPDGAKKTLHKNAIRVAEVWLDQYKKFFYAAQNVPRPSLQSSSIQERKQLREKLHCKDFNWYLQNIIPEIDVPPTNAKYYGSIQNEATRSCLDLQGNDMETILTLSQCNNQWGNQIFYITDKGYFQHYHLCAKTTSSRKIYFAQCDRYAVVWTVSPTNQIQATISPGDPSPPLCLDFLNPLDLLLKPCNSIKRSQQWSFKYHFNVSMLNTIF